MISSGQWGEVVVPEAARVRLVQRQQHSETPIGTSPSWTTASLPWMTGTSVNPLLRAAYMANRGDECGVTLLVSWLAPCDQKLVHPNAMFQTPEEQQQYIRSWLAGRVDFDPKFEIHFYPGRYAIDKGSIVGGRHHGLRPRQ